ncbi:sugar phosphate isomerase/epimerase family protein [Tautonia sociabilis]|uniref:Sugar phosphate isomerase/epimerase n=1 Tax=Tautonia sociabilis TaxID=2080755 RepID=A0A432MLI7_9BACT|nr:sugar phosphate isomerase/epimerase family protein [Tautonia sociabilis]RUL88284.1 sugar phosphate isomerase/epimerase [Tautonia sociabilis]
MMMRRREFLAAASGASALAGRVPGVAAPSPQGGRTFTMDLVPGMVGVDLPFPRLVELASRAGFESVAPDAGDLGSLDDEGMAALIEHMREHGLVFGASGLPVDFRKDDEAFREGMAALPGFADVLRRAGVTRVGTWLMPRSDELTYLANFKQHVRRLREVASVLGDRGLRFGLEYVGPKTLWSSGRYPFVHTMAEARELIAAIDRENVGLVLDSWHWYTAGESADEIRSLSNEDVVACDLNDAPAGIPVDEQIDNQRELPASTGVIDVEAFLEALVAIGYDGPVRAEPFNATLNAMDDEEAIEAVAEAMRRAFARIG